MFDIVTSRDFLSKLEADYTDFKDRTDSARHALNCIITAYHLHEWVWADWLKNDFAIQSRLGIRKIATFERWLDRECPGFPVLRSLTNGTKHLRPTNFSTQRVDGSFGSGPFGIGPFGIPYLLIDHGANKPERWETADQLIDASVMFWRIFFETYRPDAALPP